MECTDLSVQADEVGPGPIAARMALPSTDPAPSWRGFPAATRPAQQSRQGWPSHAGGPKPQVGAVVDVLASPWYNGGGGEHRSGHDWRGAYRWLAVAHPKGVSPVLLFFLLSLTARCPAGAALAVVYVDRDAPGPTYNGLSWDTAFLKIQEGVDAATPNGKVWVADVTYVENTVIGEGVQLYGGFLGAAHHGHETDLSQRDFVRHVAMIDGNQAGRCVTMALNAVIDGFTVTNGKATKGGGASPAPPPGQSV